MKRLVSYALVLFAMTPGTTQAAMPNIVPQHGIEGVELGMTRSEVRGTWGPADHIAVTYLGESDTKYVRMRWDSRKLFAGFIDSTESQDVEEPGTSLLEVGTKNRAHRTQEGAGPGISERTLRKRLPKVSCSTYAARRACVIGEPGTRQTIFVISHGTVSETRIADVF